VEVILDRDTGSVYVRLQETPPGIEPQPTHGYRKYGITMVWDGHGGLLGIEFASDQPEVAAVRTVSSAEMAVREGLVTSA
jgi:hypothetical protein